MQTRRQFLEFIGRGSMAGALSGSPFLRTAMAVTALPFQPLKGVRTDDVVVADGFNVSMLIREGQTFGPRGERFGADNDFLCFVPMRSGDTRDGLLWVNHESFEPVFVTGRTAKGGKTKAEVDVERGTVGGSIVRVRGTKGGGWEVVAADPLNRRLDATTRIPIIAPRTIAGSRTAVGTLANCSGGRTPWGTILTAEENYDMFVGELSPKPDGPRVLHPDWGFGWEAHYDVPPEHYGWIVEVDVRTGAAKKLTALGRFAHEGALVVTAGDGRPVAYMGDDTPNQFIYKFVGEKPGSLETGELYVASTVKGEWLSLSRERQPILRKAFKDQTEVLIHARSAAAMLGATPQDRPEGMAQDPVTKAVFVSLTNNKDRGNLHGSLLKIVERDGDPRSLRFTASTFATGGASSGFSCPDNIAFDAQGNLWMTSDMSGSSMGRGEHERFGNNGLFYVPTQGPDAGKAFQVASAPVDAEFTGPCFAPDGQSLFLSVQHPGETTKDPAAPTSRWPRGEDRPRSAVIVITGPAMAKLLA